MHPEAYDYVARFATTEPLTVLDIGGRNVNGSVRDLFPAAEYTALDIRPGEGVDIVADAATWEPDRTFDLIVCTEVFEHTPDWRKILRTAHRATAPGGRIVLTMAGPGRPPHSAIDPGPIHEGEYYANVHPGELAFDLAALGWGGIEVDFQPSPADTRATAVRK